MFRFPVFLVGVLASSAAVAQVPTSVTIAVDVQEDGADANGTYSMTLEAFDGADGGTPIVTESFGSVVVVNGVAALDIVLEPALGEGDVFLELTINGETLSPRFEVASVPFARRSATSDSVGSSSEETLLGLISAGDTVDPNGGLTRGSSGLAVGDGALTGENFADASIDFDKLAGVRAVPLFTVSADCEYLLGAPGTVTLRQTCPSEACAPNTGSCGAPNRFKQCFTPACTLPAPANCQNLVSTIVVGFGD